MINVFLFICPFVQVIKSFVTNLKLVLLITSQAFISDYRIYYTLGLIAQLLY